MFLTTDQFNYLQYFKESEEIVLQVYIDILVKQNFLMIKYILMKVCEIYAGMFGNSARFRDISDWKVFGRSLLICQRKVLWVRLKCNSEKPRKLFLHSVA